MSKKNEPGGRIDGETRKAYEAFVVYRSEKSISKTFEKLREKGGKSAGKLRTLEYWCSKYRWVERLQEWEDYLDGIARDEAVKERRKWVKEEKSFFNAVFMASVKNLKIKDTDKEKMSYADILNYGKAAIEGRRRLYGESDKISEIRFQNEDSDRYEKNMIDAIRNMSDEELREHLTRYNEILQTGGEGVESEDKPCDLEPEERSS